MDSPEEIIAVYAEQLAAVTAEREELQNLIDSAAQAGEDFASQMEAYATEYGAIEAERDRLAAENAALKAKNLEYVAQCVAASDQILKLLDDVENANAERDGWKAQVTTADARYGMMRGERDRLAEVVEMIEELRTDEGDVLSIPNPNPDFGGPAHIVLCSWDFNEDNRQSYSGETLRECLIKACQDREARKTIEATEED